MNTPNVYESIIAGSLSGMTAITVCHPIDVIRTQYQINPQKHLLSIVKQSSSFNQLYAGFYIPFFAQSVYKTVIFATNTATNNNLFKGSQSTKAIFLSGCISGFTNSFIVTPVELIRTRQIMNSSRSIVANKSILMALRETALSLYAEKGFLGFYRGLLTTIVRDSVGMGFALTVFKNMKSLLKKQFMPSEKTDPMKMSNEPYWVKIIAGTSSGLAYWSWALPIDSIKTILESGKVTMHHHPNKMTGLQGFQTSHLVKEMLLEPIRIVSHLLYEKNFYNLYRAWPVAFGRGVPSATIMLVSYDIVSESLVTQRLNNLS